MQQRRGESSQLQFEALPEHYLGPKWHQAPITLMFDLEVVVAESQGVKGEAFVGIEYQFGTCYVMRGDWSEVQMPWSTIVEMQSAMILLLYC